MSADDILDTIEHTLDDWATSDDAMRWTPEDQQPPDLTLRIVANVEPFVRALVAFGDRIAELGRHFERADLIQKPLPRDPMQRALEARRNRHTGPTPPRLDGRRR